MLPIAGGAVHGDQRGEDTHQEQDQHHVLSKPAAIVLSCITLYCIVTDSAMSSSPYVLLLHPWRPVLYCTVLYCTVLYCTVLLTLCTAAAPVAAAAH